MWHRLSKWIFLFGLWYSGPPLDAGKDAMVQDGIGNFITNWSNISKTRLSLQEAELYSFYLETADKLYAALEGRDRVAYVVTGVGGALLEMHMGGFLIAATKADVSDDSLYDSCACESHKLDEWLTRMRLFWGMFAERFEEEYRHLRSSTMRTKQHGTLKLPDDGRRLMENIQAIVSLAPAVVTIRTRMGVFHERSDKVPQRWPYSVDRVRMIPPMSPRALKDVMDALSAIPAEQLDITCAFVSVNPPPPSPHTHVSPADFINKIRSSVPTFQGHTFSSASSHLF